MKKLIYVLLGLSITTSCGDYSKPKEDQQAEKAPKKRPNIVFIISDDHAYQAISAY